MKTPTRENCNAHALYHSIKIIIGKIINNMNRISHYDETKGTSLSKLVNNSSL